jgi:hypothetical protein
LFILGSLAFSTCTLWLLFPVPLPWGKPGLKLWVVF